MEVETYSFNFDVYENADALSAADKALLETARQTTANAYAPYSRFYVGAAARINDGSVICGTNQENASYPAGLCAERVLLSAVASQHRKAVIEAMAISYDDQNGPSENPISPCGICRQSLLEFEERQQQPMRIILSGMKGKVYIINGANCLLPFAFKGDHLKK